MPKSACKWKRTENRTQNAKTGFQKIGSPLERGLPRSSGPLGLRKYWLPSIPARAWTRPLERTAYLHSSPVGTHILCSHHVHEHLCDYDSLRLHVCVVICFAWVNVIHALFWSLAICLSVVCLSCSFLDVKLRSRLAWVILADVIPSRGHP